MQLDADQNGMLSASELARWRDGGLTTHFVARLFQEVNTYPNKDGMQNEVPPRPTPHSQLSGRPPLPCNTHFTSLHPVQALPPLSPPYPYLL